MRRWAMVRRLFDFRYLSTIMTWLTGQGLNFDQWGGLLIGRGSQVLVANFSRRY
jgi:hypothetical protein